MSHKNVTKEHIILALLFIANLCVASAGSVNNNLANATSSSSLPNDSGGKSILQPKPNGENCATDILEGAQSSTVETPLGDTTPIM